MNDATTHSVPTNTAPVSRPGESAQPDQGLPGAGLPGAGLPGAALPGAGVPGAGQSTARERRNTGPVAIVTAVLGGLLVLGLVVSASVAAFVSMSVRGSGSTTYIDGAITTGVDDLTGVSGLDVSVGAAQLTIEYSDIQGAQLTASGSHADGWRITRSGEALEVRSPQLGIAGGLRGSCIFGVCPPSRSVDMSATLTLPRALEDAQIDSVFSIGAGSLTVSGNFGDLDVYVGVGEATLTGVARALDASVDVGSLTAELTNVAEANIEVSVGEALVTLLGEAPRNVGLVVDLGDAELAVPRGEYAVTTETDLGDVENQIGSVPGASHAISAEVSLGDAVLKFSE